MSRVTATRIKSRRAGDRIAEHVFAPTQRRRRRAFQTRLNPAKVVAVSWAQHKPMFAEANRAAVPVDRRMPQIEDRHNVSSSIGVLARDGDWGQPFSNPTDHETHDNVLVAPNRRI